MWLDRRRANQQQPHTLEKSNSCEADKNRQADLSMQQPDKTTMYHSRGACQFDIYTVAGANNRETAERL